MSDPNTPNPTAVAGARAQRRGHIYDLVSRVASPEGSHKHMASKEDLAKAKIWTIVPIAPAVISILALAFNFVRLYFSFKS